MLNSEHIQNFILTEIIGVFYHNISLRLQFKGIVNVEFRAYSEYVILTEIIGVLNHNISLRLQSIALTYFKSPEFFSFLRSSCNMKNPCKILPLKKSWITLLISSQDLKINPVTTSQCVCLETYCKTLGEYFLLFIHFQYDLNAMSPYVQQISTSTNMKKFSSYEWPFQF